MSTATAGAAPAAPTPSAPLPPHAQAALQAVLAAVQQASSAAQVKPAEVNRLVDERLAAKLTPATDEARLRVGAEATAQAARLRTLVDGVAAGFARVEQAMPGRVETLVAQALEKLAPRPVQLVTRDGLPMGKPQGHVRVEFEEIAGCVALGLNVFLSGPAGCGKTHLAAQLAEALGLRFSFLSLTAGVSESRLVGRFAPIGEGGRFVYVPAPFVDFYENGGLFLLDEVDAADPNVMLTLNAALANGHMETPNPAKPVIARHKDFRLIAAANTWGHGADRQYVGRTQLDASTLDRFCAAQFELDYDEKFEAAAGEPTVVAWAHGLRAAVRSHKVRRVVSTRLILDGSLRVRAGAPLSAVKAAFLRSWTEQEKRLVGE